MLEILISKTKEYLTLPRGFPIAVREELIFVEEVEIGETIYKAYFKNKTLKHFVERRQEELSKRNPQEKVEAIIVAMIYDLHESLKSYTTLQENKKRKNSYLVYKDFGNPLKTPVTVVLEKEFTKNEVLIVISYYFTKR